MYQHELPDYLNQIQKQKIALFVDILLQYQKKINLIAKKQNTKDIWIRHIFDCLRIIPVIKKQKQNIENICDIGSGAGFPGIIIAIAIQNTNIHLVEQKNNKALFLQNVINKLQIKNASVHPYRIEKWHSYNKNISPDIVTARAVAPIEKLCQYINCICNKKTIALLFCGNKKTKHELENAKNIWYFDYQVIHDKTLQKTNIGPIVKIEKLSLIDKINHK